MKLNYKFISQKKKTKKTKVFYYYFLQIKMSEFEFQSNFFQSNHLKKIKYIDLLKEEKKKFSDLLQKYINSEKEFEKYKVFDIQELIKLNKQQESKI